MKARFFLVFPLIFLYLVAYSQVIPPVDDSQFKYELSLVAPEQLSEFDDIAHLHEDDLGFLWFVSNSGLHCFDGKTVLTYNDKGRDDFFGLTTEGSEYTQLMISDDKVLWVLDIHTGAITGIDMITKTVVKRIVSQENFVNGQVFLASEKGGDSYFMSEEVDTKEILLHCLSCDDSEPQLITKGEGLTDYRIWNGHHYIRLLSTGVLKISMDGKQVDTISTIPYLRITGENNEELKFIEIDKGGMIYFEEGNELVPVPSYPKGNSRGVIKCFDYENEFWLTTPEMELYIFDKDLQKEIDYSFLISELLRTESPNSLAFSFFEVIKTSGGEYLLPFSNGMLKMTLKSDPKEKYQENLFTESAVTSMRGITEDANGNIYASYYTGLSVKPKGENKFRDFRDSNTRKDKGSNTYGLSIWENKLIWNTIVFDLASTEQDYFYSEEYGGHITHYLEADTLWAYEWFENIFMYYDLKNNTSAIIKRSVLPVVDYISSLVLDEATQLFWMPTYKHGLRVFDKQGEMVKIYSTKELGLPDRRQSIFELEMEGDTIWFGTELGLGFLNKKTNESQILVTKVGDFKGNYQYNAVFSILNTKGDFFYLGTQRGICRFDKKTFQFDYLSPKHPLANIEFNRGSRFESSEGKLYFGSVDGLYSFFPNELEFVRSTSLAHLAFSSISIYNSKLDENKIIDKNLQDFSHLDLKYTDTNVKINFSAPSEEMVFYKYRILGLMKNWSPYSQDGVIEITSFPVGDFEVEVKATKTPNLNDENQPTLNLSISKPNVWFKKPWVIVLLFLAGLSLIFFRIRAAFQEKLARRKELELLRVKISSDLHDDVGSILTGIAMQSEVMSLGKNEEEKKPLGELSAMSRDAMDRMRDIVWALDSRKDKYANLIDRMRSFVRQSLEKKNITHRFKLVNIDESGFLNPNIRQQLYLIFKEAITNIVKHSDATNVVISIEKYRDKFILTIHDNGSEKPIQASDGLGTQNMKSRAEALGGIFKFDYQNGYRVTVSVDRGK